MNKITAFLLLIAAFVLGSCTTESPCDAPQRADGKYVYAMQFDGDAPGYDGVSSRASKSWKNGAAVFLTEYGTKLGVATYNGGTWSLVTDAPLSGSGSCEAVHIDGVSATGSGRVSIDATKAVYEGSGSWSVSGNTLTLSASLSPSLGRIRLKGSNGTTVSLSGLQTYTSFDKDNGTFETSTDAVSTTIQSGYTPYLYGTLAGSTISTNGYTMTCPSDMLQPGTSGWVNYPTASSHTGWVSGSGGGSHEYVDLGLSVKWATCNIGASKPEDYGDYFAWGETKTKSDYSWSTYLDSPNRGGNSFTKYALDKKTVLDPEDDVAHVKWGGSWRMPTKAEQDDLRTKCTWTWTTQNGVKGRLVTGPNGNSIFLPAAGGRDDSSLYDAGNWGYYWSSSLSESRSDFAYRLFFNSDYVNWGGSSRFHGFSVRPVCP